MIDEAHLGLGVGGRTSGSDGKVTASAVTGLGEHAAAGQLANLGRMGSHLWRLPPNPLPGSVLALEV